ncbi:MAG TPA: sulfotransferase, partial [Gammaproteobacteria bacterium]|nr:sulfotransferase [Gammaproteobacteria bacterium]
DLTPQACDTLARRYLDHLAETAPAEARRVTDKLPANFLHLGLISQLFPDARIIHCVRDPMDTCLSCYFQNFSPAYAYTFRLSHLGEFYRQYRRIMDHWGTVLEMPILEIRYEDLVNDQERISRALVEHCGLEWDKRCLNFHQARRVVAPASYDQVRQPMYTRSAQRWRRYADQLAPLRSVLGGDAEGALPPPARQKDEAKSLLQRGNNEAAHALLTRLCACDPADAEGRYLLGRASAALGRVDEALAHYRESLRGAPDNAALLKDLGDAFFGLERLDDAAACYAALVEKRPTAYAHYSLANVYTRQQRLDEAVDHYRRALVLEPGRAEIYNNLGNALRYLGEYPQAADAYGKALALNPDHPMAHEGHANLGSALMLMGRPDEAGESFRRALALKPDAPRAVAGLADILEKQGCFQQAYDLMKPLLDAGRADSNMALVLAALCRPLDRCDEAIALMKAILADKQARRLDVFEEITLHFMLGRLYDSAKEYDKAFPHFRTANGLSTRRFDLAQFERYVDAIITTFSADFMARAPRAGNRSQRPVFIVGMPRSGTSLVEQILASHPDVFGAGELEEMHRIVADLPHELGGQTPYPKCVSSLTPGACDKLAKRYLDHLDALSPGQSLRVTDKMPSNFLHLGLINLLFPEARIIHCVRDPLDTCLSCYFQNFAVLSYSHDLGQLGTYYRHYERLMAHWLPLLDIPVMEVRYEDMVANQEATSRAIVEFCGLQWDERCLQFYKTRRLVATASYDQIRQPMYSSSAGKWRHYADHLEPLRQALGEQSDALA